MSPQSLLLPRSTSCGDPRHDPRSSKETRLPSIGQWDSFKVVVAAPEPSPLPNSLAEELPMHHGSEKASKKKKPGYFWGMKHKYWIYIMVLIGVLALASIIGGATAIAAATSKMNAKLSASPVTMETVTMTMTAYHHHSRHHNSVDSSTTPSAPSATSTMPDRQQAGLAGSWSSVPTLVPIGMTTAVTFLATPAVAKINSKRAISRLDQVASMSSLHSKNTWAGPSTTAATTSSLYDGG